MNDGGVFFVMMRVRRGKTQVRSAAVSDVYKVQHRGQIGCISASQRVETGVMSGSYRVHIGFISGS